MTKTDRKRHARNLRESIRDFMDACDRGDTEWMRQYAMNISGDAANLTDGVLSEDEV